VSLLTIAIGTAMSAVAFTKLIIPNQMLSGGVNGVSILISRFTGLQVGTLVLLINIPIIILGYRKIGGRFIALTTAAVASYSLLVNLIPTSAAVDDLLLASVFGGLLHGLGLALVLRAGGSTGGTDVIGVILNRTYGLSMGEVMLGFNTLIVGASALLFDLNAALYTLVLMFVTSRTVDTLQNPSSRKTAIIITSEPQKMAERIHQQLQRGVTFLQGEGSYEGSERKVLMCVLTRFETVHLKEIVLSVDPNAFMTISETGEVVGRFAPRSVFRKVTRN
jgi:uncharacterized membrane-anchored protein YitT (DUF2179 family)